MQQMQEVFYQWQAELAQQTYAVPQSFAPVPYAPQPQQWSPSQPPPPHSGYASPQLLPNSPMSGYTNTPPPMSPQPQAVFAHYAPAPEIAAVEMMGSVPEGPPAVRMLEAPAAQPSVQKTSVHVGLSRSRQLLLDVDYAQKKKSFFSKIKIFG
jgi:hypothetical protein